MKRIMILFIALLLTLTGCTKHHNKIREPVNYYYLSTQTQLKDGGNVLSCEVRDKFGHSNDYAYLIGDYLLGPQSTNSISPFPAGTSLIHFDLMKDTALVNLSSHLALLKGQELTLACACIGRTVLEITGMKSVQISAQNDLLAGKEYITINESSLILADDYIPAGG